MPAPIDAYVWTTPNGYKALLLVEELGLPYTARWANIGKGDQHKPEDAGLDPRREGEASIRAARARPRCGSRSGGTCAGPRSASSCARRPGRG